MFGRVRKDFEAIDRLHELDINAIETTGLCIQCRREKNCGKPMKSKVNVKFQMYMLGPPIMHAGMISLAVTRKPFINIDRYPLQF